MVFETDNGKENMDMEYKSELIPRILRDIDDSVLALDERGHIISEKTIS